MWRERVLVWEDCSHDWNKFGVKTDLSNFDDDLYAKGLIIWRKISLGDFIDRIIAVFDASNDYIDDKGILSGVVLAISAVSLFPFNIKIIKDDEVASQFLSLIHREKAEHFILKKEFEESVFGKKESLKLLINNFVKNGILIDDGTKYIINGKVLNRAHIIDSEKENQ